LAAFNKLDFLSEQERDDILYDNAARFLRLSGAAR
jgi:predicted TIM-barrel fold metal-dependent hydrolase